MNNEKQKESTLKYIKEHVKQVNVSMPKECYKELKEITEKEGIPVNTFIKKAVEEKAKSMGYELKLFK